ncbi:MAG: DUF58 domain-containing protein [Nocardioidaceae bacterium]
MCPSLREGGNFRADQVPLSQLAPEQALRRLELQIVRRLEGLLQGEHLALLPGPGSDLAEARTYVAGSDDVRRMDWALSARTTIPHVRDVIADRELETWALVDLSPSMFFGTAAMEKRDLAVAAVATIGLLTFRAGDRFGGYVVRQGQLTRRPAGPGRRALFGLLLSLLQPGAESAAPTTAMTLAGSITALSRAQRRRGLRVVVSDFLEPSDAGGLDSPPSWERPMRELRSRHQVLAVEVIDPRELYIPNVGSVLVRDAETGRVRAVDTSHRKVRTRYAAAAQLQRASTARALRRAGVSHLVLRTDRDWVADIARFAARQRRVPKRLHEPRASVRE